MAKEFAVIIEAPQSITVILDAETSQEAQQKAWYKVRSALSKLDNIVVSWPEDIRMTTIEK